MKFTKTAIDQLAITDGRKERIEWDDDVPGFGIRLREGGSKSFIVQYRIGGRGGKQGRETLGNIKKFNSIDAARKAARTVLEAAGSGQNPRAIREEAERKIAQAVTPLIDRYLAAKKSGWSAKYLEDVTRSLKVYFRRLHAKALTEIKRDHVSEELATIQRNHGGTSRNRARSHLSSFFNWAIGEGLCETNPAEKTNKAPEISRDRALSDAELRALWNCLDGAVFSEDERDLVRLMILTLQRESQLGMLRSNEVSDEGKRLTWLRARTKNKGFSKHIMPIGPMAQEIVAKRDGRDFLFGKAESGFTTYTHLKDKIDEIVKFNEHWVLHDIRRTGKTAMAEHIDVRHEVSEAILNHGKKDMDKVYNNAQYVQQKLEAITKWESYVLRAVSEDTALAA